jgi:hypothetical protein
MFRSFDPIGPSDFISHFQHEPQLDRVPGPQRGNETFGGSAMTAIIFKTKLSALMEFIQKHEILGKVPAFVWRVEYQK